MRFAGIIAEYDPFHNGHAWQLEAARAALQDRQLSVEKAGSIAEAALQLNGVFEAAQAAAQQYLDNIKQRSEQMEAVCAQREAACAQREAESKEKIDQQLREAAQAAQRMEESTRRRCMAMEAEAKQKSEAYWSEVSSRLESFYQEHKALKELLSSVGGGL